MGSPMPRRVKAVNVNNASAPNGTADTALEVASAGFEFDFIKRDLKASGPNLSDPTAVIKVHIPEPEITGFLADGAPTCTDRIAP